MAQNLVDSFSNLCMAAQIDVKEEMENLLAVKNEKQVSLTRAACILTECVLGFCLKVLGASDTSAADKQKKRNLLEQTWGEVTCGAHGRSVEAIHPVYVELAQSYIS